MAAYVSKRAGIIKSNKGIWKALPVWHSYGHLLSERAEGERGAYEKARKGEAKVRLSVNGPELVVKK